MGPAGASSGHLLEAKPVVGMKWEISAPCFQACQYQDVPFLVEMPGAWLFACNGYFCCRNHILGCLGIVLQKCLQNNK